MLLPTIYLSHHSYFAILAGNLGKTKLENITVLLEEDYKNVKIYKLFFSIEALLRGLSFFSGVRYWEKHN